MKNKKLLITGFGLTIANVIGGGLGYVYQILMGRLLTPADFGLLSTIVASYLLLTSPLSGAFMIVSRRVSSLSAIHQWSALSNFYRNSLKTLIMIVAPISLMIILCLPLMQNFFQTSSEWVVWIFALMVLLAPILVVNDGAFQGLQKFRWMAAFNVGGISLKITLSVLLVYVGFKVEGALVGGVIVSLAIILIGVVFLKREMSNHCYSIDLQIEPIKAYSIWPVMISNIGIATMTQVDILAVNYFFNSEQVGLYTAASIYGKVILFLPGGLVLALFPKVAENHIKNVSSFGVVLSAIMWTSLICGAVSIFYYVAGDSIINLSYGTQYMESGMLLSWFGFAVTPLAMAILAENILIAQGKTLFCWVFLGVLPFQLLFLYVWHSELWMILLNTGIAGFVVCIVGYGFMLIGASNSKKFFLNWMHK